MNPFFVTDFSISDSLKTVWKSVLIYETIIETEKSINAAAKELIEIGYKAVNNSQIISEDLKRKIFNICGELETVDIFFKANDITYPNQKNLDNCLEEMKEEFIKWNFWMMVLKFVTK